MTVVVVVVKQEESGWVGLIRKWVVRNLWMLGVFVSRSEVGQQVEEVRKR